MDLYKNALLILSFENFSKVLEYLGHSTRKIVSKTFVKNLLTNRTLISSVDQVNILFAIIDSLISDQKDQPPLIGRLPRTASHLTELNQSVIDIDDYADDQELVAKLVHLLVNEDKMVQLDLLKTAFNLLANGGLRLRFVIPSLVFRSCALAVDSQLYSHLPNADKATLSSQIFQFTYQLVSTLLTKGTDSIENVTSSDSQNFVAEIFHSKYVYDLALKLYLQASLTADTCKNEEMAYEFAVQALLIYEENISDSKSQILAIKEIILSLSQTLNFSVENYDTLSTKVLLYSTKLLRKPDQCQSICLAAQLFWLDGGCALRRDSRKVLECLQKSLKIADSCMDATLNVSLFVEILNSYVFFYENGCDSIQPKTISGLIDLITTNLSNMESSPNYSLTVEAFERTKLFVQNLLVNGPSGRPTSPPVTVHSVQSGNQNNQTFSTTTIQRKEEMKEEELSHESVENGSNHEEVKEIREEQVSPVIGYSQVESGFRSLNLPSFEDQDEVAF